MRGTLKILRAAQWGMSGSIVLYAVMGEVLRLRAKTPDPSLSYVFTTAGVAIVGVIFVVRRTLVLRSAEGLAAHPDDALSLSHWKNGHIVTYILCDVLGLFGLASRFVGDNFQQSLPYYIGGFVLLLFFGPKKPLAS
jgi:hypothetical protein